jgi:hypothetical protein
MKFKTTNIIALGANIRNVKSGIKSPSLGGS